MTEYRLFLVCMVVTAGFSLSAVGAGDRLDYRLQGAALDSRMIPSRLSLPPVRDKDKKEELEVKKKTKVSSAPAVRRVTREDSQRKNKTKRVVASQ